MADRTPVFLLAFANDKAGTFLRSIASENQILSQILRKLDEEKYCELIVLADATVEDIIRIFKEKRNRVRVFHYGGHADGYNLLMKSADGSEEVADAASFARFLSQQEDLKLVFLNACSTQEQGQALLNAGAGYVITTSEAINDQAAQKFSQQFYESLASGVTIEVAFKDASEGVQITAGGDTRSLYWEETEEVETDKLPWVLMTGDQADAQWQAKQKEGKQIAAQVKGLVAASKMEKAMKLMGNYLKEIEDTGKYDELVVLAKKYKSVKRQSRIGIISNSDAQIQQQQVAVGVVELASSLDSQGEHGLEDLDDIL